jgi:hypothetical protein
VGKAHAMITRHTNKSDGVEEMGVSVTSAVGVGNLGVGRDISHACIIVVRCEV